MNLYRVGIYHKKSGEIDIGLTLGYGAYEYFTAQLARHGITPAGVSDDDIIPKSVQKRIARYVKSDHIPIPEATMYAILQPYLELKKEYCNFAGKINLK